MNADKLNPKQSSAADSIGVYLRLSAVAVVAMLASGCADLRWHKPGATQATLAEELGQCRQHARLEAGQELLPLFSGPLMLGADSQGRPLVVQTHQRETERLLLEQELMRRCMRGKGYELVPAEKQ